MGLAEEEARLPAGAVAANRLPRAQGEHFHGLVFCLLQFACRVSLYSGPFRFLGFLFLFLFTLSFSLSDSWLWLLVLSSIFIFSFFSSLPCICLFMVSFALYLESNPASCGAGD